MKLKLLNVLLFYIQRTLTSSVIIIPKSPFPEANEPNKIKPEVFSETLAPEGAYTFMIFTITNTGENTNSKGWKFCSSALISPMWVLLAAHCTHHPNLNPKNILLVGGKSDMNDYVKARMSLSYDKNINEEEFGIQERRGKEVYEHPWYDPILKFSDIALIKGDRAFVLGRNITTVGISKVRMTGNEKCTLLGWRSFVSDYKLNHLQNARMVRSCKKLIFWLNFACYEASTKGFCGGDSGGPLYCDGAMWAVASFSDSKKPDKTSCNIDGNTVYTELYPDLYWIEAVYGKGAQTRNSILFTLNLLLISLNK